MFLEDLCKGWPKQGSSVDVEQESFDPSRYRYYTWSDLNNDRVSLLLERGP